MLDALDKAELGLLVLEGTAGEGVGGETLVNLRQDGARGLDLELVVVVDDTLEKRWCSR